MDIVTLRILSIFAALIAVTALPVGTASAPVAASESDRARAIVAAAGIPPTVMMDDLMGTALVAQLDEPIEVSTAAPARSYRAGDVGYWVEEQRLFVFLTSGSALPDSEVVLVGHVRTGLGELRGCIQGCRVGFVADASSSGER